MKQKTTLVRHHGEKKWRLALGPDHSPNEHKVYVKNLIVGKKHPDIAEIMVFDRVRRMRINPMPKPDKKVVEQKTEAPKQEIKKRGRPKKITRQQLANITSQRFATV